MTPTPAAGAGHEPRAGVQRRSAGAERRRRRCCATPSPSPRPASTRRRSPTCIRARSRRNIFEAPLTYDYLARPAKLKPQTAMALPEISDDFKRFVFRIRPASTSPTTRRSRAAKRELIAADYVYFDQAPLRPAVQEPEPVPARERQGRSACPSCARRRSPTSDPSPTTPRSRACARSTATRFEVRAGRAGAALPLHLRRRRA